MSELNIAKAAKNLSVTTFPKDDLCNICGDKKIHEGHEILHKIIRTTANDLNNNFNNNIFPLFFLWIHSIFSFFIKEFLDNNLENEVITYLVRIFEITAQSVLLVDKLISHKGGGRFKETQGNQYNLLGAGSYLNLLESHNYIIEIDIATLKTLIKSRNQLPTAHGFTSSSDSNLKAYIEKVMKIISKLIKPKVKKNVSDSFNSFILPLSNQQIIEHFLTKNINNYVNKIN